jgi:hypothetical protein
MKPIGDPVVKTGKRIRHAESDAILEGNKCVCHKRGGNIKHPPCIVKR